MNGGRRHQRVNILGGARLASRYIVAFETRVRQIKIRAPPLAVYAYKHV